MAKLPNEPNALGAPVQSSEFKVQSSEELRNEANAEIRSLKPE